MDGVSARHRGACPYHPGLFFAAGLKSNRRPLSLSAAGAGAGKPRLQTTMQKQTLSFQAEVKQILHLVTHTLYSNKEIFVRELISNASDACDKLRFEARNQPALYEDQPNLEVRIAFDKDARTITISDNGIGLSAEEAVANLGTIAKSGTR